jgi:hypothetical protein
MADDFELNGPYPEEESNRSFMIVAGILAGLIVLSLACMGIYVLVIQPGQETRRIAQATEAAVVASEQAQMMTETAAAGRFTPTVFVVPTSTVSPQPSVTPTQVVVLPSDTPTNTNTPITQVATDPAGSQTVEAAAGGAASSTPAASPTALPATGFADEAGLPGLVLVGAVLVVVIFVSRRLRMNSAAG